MVKNMWEFLESFNQFILVIWMILTFGLFIGYFINFIFWIYYRFISLNNSKNCDVKDYLKAILKQEGYGYFKIKKKLITMHYFNISYNKKTISIKKWDINKKDVYNIYFILVNIQSLKWKIEREKYIGFLFFIFILFLIFILTLVFLILIRFLFVYSIINAEQLNLFLSVINYTGLISLLISWIFWVFVYEQMRKDILNLASDYLNDLEYLKIKRISFLKNLFIGI